ncbi:hypothetical protein SSP35_14_00070 [Streptomyces sp. NBRC 110611]|uniref:DUF397 domain-containing protein n=1 Tax=Streptomyces sp. NBRC 110611 TaxID=1621259 RepID=UPI00082E018C|nr:DUF397 domain-containing protein [Streptomyces sp. NBRC 110611]GAU69674.1 hypothetical protein SSP35_14_00070 [Streptomyces sp. NBRC 110611]
MRTIDLTNMTWRKSSYSNPDGGACIEVADSLPAVVPVRDGKDFEAAAWSSFVAAVEGTELPA